LFSSFKTVKLTVSLVVQFSKNNFDNFYILADVNQLVKLFFRQRSLCYHITSCRASFIFSNSEIVVSDLDFFKPAGLVNLGRN